jgi:hypothetical protein
LHAKFKVERVKIILELSGLLVRLQIFDREHGSLNNKDGACLDMAFGKKTYTIRTGQCRDV